MSGVLTASIEGGVLVLLVWAITRWVPGLPGGVRCALWWLASLKLLVGLAGAPLELALLPSAPAEVVPVVLSGGPVEIPAVPTPPAATPLPVAGLAWILWGAGFLGFAALTARQVGQAFALRRRAPPASTEVLILAASIAQKLGVRRRVDIRVTDEVPGPLTLGVLRPTVILPAALEGESLRLALAHELAHVRRHDLLWGWIPLLASRLFFFHPLAHLAHREYLLAREAACDAAVLALPDTSPGEYGALLLRLGVRRVSPTTAGMVSSVSQLKRRLVMMQGNAKGRFGRWSAVLVVAFGAMIPMTVVAREPPVSTCEVVVHDEQGRRTMSCDEAGVVPPARKMRTQVEKMTAAARSSITKLDPEAEQCMAVYEKLLTCVGSSKVLDEGTRASMGDLRTTLQSMRMAWRFPAARAGMLDGCRQLQAQRENVFDTLGCE